MYYLFEHFCDSTMSFLFSLHVFTWMSLLTVDSAHRAEFQGALPTDELIQDTGEDTQTCSMYIQYTVYTFNVLSSCPVYYMYLSCTSYCTYSRIGLKIYS